MTGAAATRVADAYWSADPHSLIRNGVVVPVDPLNPTDEEKAGLFLQTLKKNGQAIVGHVSANDSDASAQAAKEAAQAAAIADLE